MHAAIPCGSATQGIGNHQDEEKKRIRPIGDATAAVGRHGRGSCLLLELLVLTPRALLCRWGSFLHAGGNNTQQFGVRVDGYSLKPHFLELNDGLHITSICKIDEHIRP